MAVLAKWRMVLSYYASQMASKTLQNGFFYFPKIPWHYISSLKNAKFHKRRCFGQFQNQPFSRVYFTLKPPFLSDLFEF